MGTNPLQQLQALLTASRENYRACVDHIDHGEACDGATATIRLHHLKFNANGQPKIDDLASCLAKHAIDYAISTRHRPFNMNAQEAMHYSQQARRLFRVVATDNDASDLAGEAGELLLYFLLETVLEAPQVVAKIELKTNPALEVNGSDGIHMKWNADDELVDVYFGESKMYGDVGNALTAAFASIESFHANGMREHEYSMVTKYFKGSDDHVKDAVTELLDTGRPGPDARINHACLIGYEWAAEGVDAQQAAAEIEAEFRLQFTAQAPRLRGMLQTRLDNCNRRQYGFQVFFLPFGSVQAFRDAFSTAME